jgi:CubicO group peptidase (beta-lactamase class C family)
MAVIRQSPLLFTPGTAYGYSNSGYYTLGAIVAEVSGLPLLEDQILTQERTTR